MSDRGAGGQSAALTPCYPSAAVGALDIAVVIVAVGVAASLGLLAWTLGVSAVIAVRHERTRVAEMRHRLAATERRLHEVGAASRDVLGRLKLSRRRERA